MSIRAVCFDFQDTLAYMTDSNWSPYTLAAAEYDVRLADETFSVVLDDGWARWRTPLGIDHSQASTDERSFRAARALVHEARLRVAGVDERLLAAMAERINDIECDPQHYHLFDDAAPALERLAGAGVQANRRLQPQLAAARYRGRARHRLARGGRAHQRPCRLP